ncbi:MAG: hypothetical protein ACRDP1_04600 [Nocardioidaceae bacterium]
MWPKDGKPWEDALEMFALALENWIYDSHFAAGEDRMATVPEMTGA